MSSSIQPGTRAERLRHLFRPGWLWVIVLAIVFAVACFVVLAPWQFDRNRERQDRNFAVTSALASPVADVRDLLPLTGPPSVDVAWHLVSATGTFDDEAEVLVRLRQLNGRPAFEVLTPFVLSDGSRVLVDRGYFSATEVTEGVPVPPAPSGTVTVYGRAQPEQPDPANRAPIYSGGRTEVYGISSDALRSAQPQVRFGFIQLTAESPGVLVPIAVPQTDSGPFLSYAFQWITFGIVALGAIGFFIYRELTDEDDPNVAAGAGPDPADPDSDTGHGRAPVPAASQRRSKGRFNKADLYD